MKQGFTLIELMIGLGISALMLMMLLQNFSMINRVVRRADDLIDVDFVSAVLYNQLERDLSGAFVPPPAPEPSDLEKNSAQNKDKPEDPFSATTKEGRFDTLTFITNNPLRVYPFAKNVTIEPRMVRVAYILEPQKGKKDRYQLIRKESHDLVYKNFKTVRGFELARNIKKFSISLRYTQESNGQDDKPKKQSVEQWPLKEKEENTPLMPEYVVISLTLTDERGMREQKYDFGFTLYGFNALPLLQASLIETTTPPAVTGTGSKTQQQSSSGRTGQQGQAIKQQPQNPPMIQGFKAHVSKPSVKVAQVEHKPGTPFDMDEFEKVMQELQDVQQLYAQRRGR